MTIKWKSNGTQENGFFGELAYFVRQRLRPDNEWIASKRYKDFENAFFTEWNNCKRSDQMVLFAIELNAPQERIMKALCSIERWLNATKSNVEISDAINLIEEFANTESFGELEKLSKCNKMMQDLIEKEDGTSFLYRLSDSVKQTSCIPAGKIYAKIALRQLQRISETEEQHGHVFEGTASLVRQSLHAAPLLSLYEKVPWK